MARRESRKKRSPPEADEQQTPFTTQPPIVRCIFDVASNCIVDFISPVEFKKLLTGEKFLDSPRAIW